MTFGGRKHLQRPARNAALDRPCEYVPFSKLAADLPPQAPARAAITAATRRPEPDCIPALVEAARVPQPMRTSIVELAKALALKVRDRSAGLGRDGLVQGLMQEFALSSDEGTALMCVAEALLRIPDAATRNALIRDKITGRDWQAHLGRSESLFVNAATWSLFLTGKLAATHSERGLSSALTRVIAKHGQPVLRKGVEIAMRLMAEQFVIGETIGEALAVARQQETKGYRYSYDMLGEAAVNADDAARYRASYEDAIRAIGSVADERGIYQGPGISIKLSALHPRYARTQRGRVMDELYSMLYALTCIARDCDIGVNLDAEESERLDLSLDLLERLCHEPALRGWDGIGFVVQAYQKRCPFVIDFLIELARMNRRRLLVRLVKGAYWDSEIKRAQVDGMNGYPVFTRKVHTDASYLACARKMLGVPDAIYPQFATHNAHSVAAIYHMAGRSYWPGQYEFQCLHGMGEPLYDHVVGPVAEGKLDRPCRIYAPVGSQQTLLPYLVRRLLENGANTSFVNRISDPSVLIDDLVSDPVERVEESQRDEGTPGLPHPRIPLPRHLYGAERLNSAAIDLCNERELRELAAALVDNARVIEHAEPPRVDDAPVAAPQPVRNPAERADIVGYVVAATPHEVDRALEAATAAAPVWQAVSARDRAAILDRGADMLEHEMRSLIGLAVREAGKSLANAGGEVREAVDFLRYYAAQVRNGFSNETHRALGPVVCISPWNFPLAIFTGQVAAALAAGNTVLAKPAEQTPLTAARAVHLLHKAGVPRDALQVLPGAGETVGAQLVRDERVQGVVFTGSTEVARILQRTLAGRLGVCGEPVPLIAETGGQNAMIVDSSALAEQVVADALSSAFDSAGQRCSALRVLCVQDDVANRLLEMLKGAMVELALGNPDDLAIDIGPVIDDEARTAIVAHIEAMRAKGRHVYQAPVKPEALASFERGSFVPPTLIEIERLAELQHEVFGPVLHIVRYSRDDIDRLVDEINALGYGLTMGVHSRIDETIARITARARVGNIYVNRNVIGAVVGVQPFGGEGLSGTGPKAGGPLYLYRLLSDYPHDAVTHSLGLQTQTLAGTATALPGPTGESNTYLLLPRERVLCLAGSGEDLRTQISAVLATGVHPVCEASEISRRLVASLPEDSRGGILSVPDWRAADVQYDAVLYHGSEAGLLDVLGIVADKPGPLAPVYAYAPGARDIRMEGLVVERVISVNTAAAGGNASLMTIG